MREKIIEIIEDVTNYKGLENKLDVDLIENEILDSLGFIELVTELEETFDIEIQPTQIPSDTWRSIDNIVKMVEKKMRE